MGYQHWAQSLHFLVPSPGVSRQDPSYNTSLLTRARTQGSSMGHFEGAVGTFAPFPSSQSRRGAAAGAGAVRMDASVPSVLFLRSGFFKERKLKTQRQTNSFVLLFCFFFFSFLFLLSPPYISKGEQEVRQNSPCPGGAHSTGFTHPLHCSFLCIAIGTARSHPTALGATSLRC